MTFPKTLGLFTLLLCSINTWADILKINPNHPDEYVVVKGDTLWDISGKFLENPWQWPNLWSNNPQIKNPNLIYPGDRLYFSVVDGKPRLSFSRDNMLKPHIRELSIEQAIKIIPTDAISQFLSSPRVVTETELSTSPYVIEIAGEHLIAGTGDKVYVRSIKNPKSFGYTIYRKGQAYIDRDSKEILGYEALYIADTTIERSGDPATLLITKSDHEIRRGDRLMGSNTNELALNFFPHPPKETISANIISVLDGVSQIGQHDIVVLDKGLVNHLEVGHVLDIYHKGKVINDPFSGTLHDKVKLPDEIAGELLVFRSFERVSYALVIEANQAIHVFDRVKTP
ncbi:MAG: LysM peptidoglycan-binding domain-containing protein [Methylococcales bacterium]